MILNVNREYLLVVSDVDDRIENTPKGSDSTLMYGPTGLTLASARVEGLAGSMCCDNNDDDNNY